MTSYTLYTVITAAWERVYIGLLQCSAVGVRSYIKEAIMSLLEVHAEVFHITLRIIISYHSRGCSL